MNVLTKCGMVYLVACVIFHGQPVWQKQLIKSVTIFVFKGYRVFNNAGSEARNYLKQD